MIYNFNYSKSYKLKYLYYTITPFVFLWASLIVADILLVPTGSFFEKHWAKFFASIPMFIFFIDLLFMYKRAYVRIVNEKITVNYGNTVIRQNFFFKDIFFAHIYTFKRSNIIAKFFLGEERGIRIYLGRDKEKFIMFSCLSEDDQQKLIDIFTKKGKMKI
jgi:hypothetical protein